jgi:hypothetical protein
MSVLFGGEDTYGPMLRALTDPASVGTPLSSDQLYAFAEAIIAHESQWQPGAYHFDGPDSVVNASYGLGQIEGVTAEGYGVAVTDIANGILYDPATNLGYTVRRLLEGLARQGYSMSLAAADYNEGPGNVAAGYPDTAYVQAVLQNYQAYFTANTGAADPSVQGQPGGGGSGTTAVGLVLVALGLGWLAWRAVTGQP